MCSTRTEHVVFIGEIGVVGEFQAGTVITVDFALRPTQQSIHMCSSIGSADGLVRC